MTKSKPKKERKKHQHPPAKPSHSLRLLKMIPLISDSDPSYSLPTASACAACKFQRRKCSPDCTLAPFFPADKHRQFFNVHRLFGVSNILKLLKSIDPNLHQDAMNSIIFQSNVRAVDPAGGCHRIIVDLQRKIDAAQAELQYVLRQIASFRAQFGQQRQQQQGLQGNTINADERLTQKEILSIQQKEEGEEDVDEWPLVEMSEDVEEKVNVGSTAMALSSSDDIEVKAKTREQVQENDLKRAASFFTLTNYDTSDV